jgi:hypothetical protein
MIAGIELLKGQKGDTSCPVILLTATRIPRRSLCQPNAAGPGNAASHFWLKLLTPSQSGGGGAAAYARHMPT